MVNADSMKVCREQHLATNSQGQGHNLDSKSCQSYCKAWISFPGRFYLTCTRVGLHHDIFLLLPIA